MPYEKSYQKYIKCICPRCGTEHKLRLNWKGKGIPRKLCELCKKRGSRFESY